MSVVQRAPEGRDRAAGVDDRLPTTRGAAPDPFRQVLGRSPIRYLTEWRLHLARDLPASTDLGVTRTLASRAPAPLRSAPPWHYLGWA